MTGKERVEQILAQSKNFAAVNSTANSEVLSYLTSLRNLLRTQEQSFYDALGVDDIKGLNYTLDHINIQSKLSVLDAGGAVYKYIENHYTLKGANNNKNNTLVEENIFDLFTELLNDIDANTFIEEYIGKSNIEMDAIYDGLMDALTAAFHGITINGGFIKYIFTARGSRSSTGRYKKSGEVGKATIKINLNEAIRKGKVEIVDNRFVVTGDPQQFSSTVEKEIREYIRPELMKRLNKTYGEKSALDNMSQSVMIDLVNDIIQSQFGVKLDAEDLAASHNIAINGSPGGISGYLGELQARLYFKQLFKDVKDASIIDAGASYIKSMSGATQMDPADTIIKVANEIFNIQVKNYAKGGAEWSGATKRVLTTGEEIRDVSTATSFVSDRLQINSPVLLNFFGAATYNNMNPRYSNSPSYWEYHEVYGEFQAIFTSLKESFDTFIPNIIRLTAVLSGLDELQYENFYFQKGKMIPASGIIDGIIDALYNAPSKKIFTSSYKMFPGPTHYSPQEPYPENYAAYASETSISWRVSINFNSVLGALGL